MPQIDRRAYVICTTACCAAKLAARQGRQWGPGPRRAAGGRTFGCRGIYSRYIVCILSVKHQQQQWTGISQITSVQQYSSIFLHEPRKKVLGHFCVCFSVAPNYLFLPARRRTTDASQKFSHSRPCVNAAFRHALSERVRAQQRNSYI